MEGASKANTNKFIENESALGKTLKEVVRKISVENNQKIEGAYGISNLIKHDGTISMEAFLEEAGGIYSGQEVAKDKAKIQKVELEFAGLENASENQKERLLTEWNRSKEKHKGSKAEMMVDIILNRVLGDDFIVARTTKYDDYFSGTDFIIVNKKTGKTMCALDSLAGSETKLQEGDTPLTIKKADKTLRIVEKNGGAHIKYGIKIKGGKLALAPLDNMPVFYLDISDKKYTELAEDIARNEGELSKKILLVFWQFINSLKEQQENFLISADIAKDSSVYRKIRMFEEETLNVFIEVYSKRREELLKT